MRACEAQAQLVAAAGRHNPPAEAARPPGAPRLPPPTDAEQLGSGCTHDLLCFLNRRVWQTGRGQDNARSGAVRLIGRAREAWRLVAFTPSFLGTM